MKKLILVAFLAVCTLAAADAQIKKYDLKSGIVTFTTIVKTTKTNITTKSIIYFDDYGIKECKETLDANGKVMEQFLSDGNDLYGVYFANKEAYKRGKAYRGTEMRFDWNEVSEKGKKEGRYKKVSNVTVAGKNCEAFELNDKNSKSIFAGWNHITLSVDLTSGDIHSITKAVKIEENAKVSADKFAVPAGFAMK